MFKTFFKNELRKNLRFTVIWGLIWGFYGFVNFAFFKLIKNQPDFYSSVKNIPKELQEGFNLDPALTQTPEGYINGNFMMLLLILNAVFAVLLVNNILNNRVQNKEIFFYLSKKIQKGRLIFYTFFVSEVLLLISTTLTMLLTYIGAELLTDELVSKKFFFLITIGLFIYSSMFTALGIFIGRILSATQTMLATLGITIGITIYNVLSKISGSPEIMKYFSPLYYFDTTQIVKERSLDFLKLTPILAVSLLLILIGLILFRKKDVEV